MKSQNPLVTHLLPQGHTYSYKVILPNHSQTLPLAGDQAFKHRRLGAILIQSTAVWWALSLYTCTETTESVCLQPHHITRVCSHGLDGSHVGLRITFRPFSECVKTDKISTCVQVYLCASLSQILFQIQPSGFTSFLRVGCDAFPVPSLKF